MPKRTYMAKIWAPFRNLILPRGPTKIKFSTRYGAHSLHVPPLMPDTAHCTHAQIEHPARFKLVHPLSFPLTNFLAGPHPKGNLLHNPITSSVRNVLLITFVTFFRPPLPGRVGFRDGDAGVPFADVSPSGVG